MLKSSSIWTWGQRGVENWMEKEGKRVASGETKGRGVVGEWVAREEGVSF